MSIYSYKARTKTGAMVKGTYEASDVSTVISVLKSKDYLPIKILEKKQGLKLEFLSMKISKRDISIFCRQFATVIEAGIPVLESLDIIRKQVESKKFREILDKVYTQVQKGSSLSDSLRRFSKDLPPILINMIEAGEMSGTLDRVMNRMAIFFENENKLVRKVKGAMTYPSVIAGVSVIAVIGMLKFVVPQFVSMFSSMGGELPAATQMLINASEFISHNFLFIIIALIGAVGGTIYYFKTENGMLFKDKMMFKIPKISSMYKKMLAARFSRTMASLLSSGLPLIRAIEITDKVIGNALMSTYLQAMVNNVSKGTKFSVAVSQIPFFPSMLISMITIGEESGALDSLLDKTADFYEEETEAEVEGLTAMMEPLIIVVMAVMVGGIVVAMVQPMFGMFDQISNL